MKTRKRLCTAIMLLCCAVMVGCTNQGVEKALADEEKPYLNAVNDYLTREFGSQYSQGDVCIPSVTGIDTDDSDPDSIKVWGDFWVFNYKVSGDTLKTVSGGSHAGMMLLSKSGADYQVQAFEGVADGEDYLPSAMRIFGSNYAAFHSVNSNAQQREATRARHIAEYVKKNRLAVNLYQDYGWPAKDIERPHPRPLPKGGGE